MQLETARELLRWDEGSGSWRLNDTKDIKYRVDESLLTLKQNTLVEIHEPRTLPIDLGAEDAYDLDGLRGHTEEHRNMMMIRAEYGGCGKSYTCLRRLSLRRDPLLLRQIGPVLHHSIRQDLPQSFAPAGKKSGWFNTNTPSL